MERYIIRNRRFELEFGVIFADPSSAPEYLLNKKGSLKCSYKNYKIFNSDISPEHKIHIMVSIQDFDKRLEEVKILSLPDFLDVTDRLWDCSYTYCRYSYWESKRTWYESFGLPTEVGAKIITKIRGGISRPVVLWDGEWYWEIPTPWETDGIFKEKFTPTVILPKGYKLSKEHRIVFRNIGKGTLTEYWGDYRL